MFDEKSYSLKMDKAIEVFLKELVIIKNRKSKCSNVRSWLKLMFMDNKCQLIKLEVLQLLNQE